MCNESYRDMWLYDKPHNYVDYAADENGLWVVYMYRDRPGIVVSKIEPVRIWLDDNRDWCMILCL